MNRRLMTTVCICLLLTSTGSMATAQTSANGAIRGIVMDEQRAVLPGAIITAVSADVGGRFKTSTDSEGFYRLLELPPGQYTVTVELQGFGTVSREGIVVRAGLNIALDVPMSLSGVSETTTVKADTPLLESTDATQTLNISGDLQRGIPLSARRQWSDFLNVTPGAVQSSGSGGQLFTYLHGAEFDSHVFQIDGAEAASGQQRSVTYINFSPEMIQDVEVKLSVPDASTPLGTGAVISVVTKSGTNRLAGSASLTHQPGKWNDSNSPGGTSAAVRRAQATLTIGGPLRRDRAWVFGSYAFEDQSIGISRTAVDLDGLQRVEPGFQPFDGVTRSHLTFVKLTTQLDNHHLIASHQYDVQPSAKSGPRSVGPYDREDAGGHAGTAVVSSVWSSSVTSRITASVNTRALQEVAYRDDRPQRVVFESVFSSGGRLVGSNPLATLDNSSVTFATPYRLGTLSASVSHFRRGLAGSHELQGGVFWQRAHEEVRQNNVHDGFVLEQLAYRPDSAAPVSFYRQIYDEASFASALGYAVDSAAYVQDVWRPMARLAVSAGFRFDWLRRHDQLFDTQIQRSIEFGPRLGVNYMFDDQRGVRFSYGRAHEGLTSTRAAAGSVTGAYRELFDLDGDGELETTYVTPGTRTLTSNRTYDLSRHQPFVEEISGSYHQQLPEGFAVSVGAMRRTYRNRMAFVDTNTRFEGPIFSGYRDERFNEIYNVTDNIWNTPVYTAVDLNISRQGSAMSVLGSYTRAFRSIDGRWQPNDPAALIQPDVFANDRGIGNVRGGRPDANSLSGTHMSEGSQWRDHVLRTAVVLQLPAQFQFATSYAYQSGPWSGPIVTRLTAPDPRFGPERVILGNGRVVSNPAATTIRFAHPTRGEGQFHLPAAHFWNIKVGRRISLATGHLTLSAELFNVVNADADLLPAYGANQLYSSTFGLGSQRQPPRAGQLGLTWVF